MAEIPDLKQKEEKRKGAAGAWPFSSSAPASGGLSGAGTGTVSRLLQGPLWFLTGNAGMGIVTMLAVAGSVYGLYSLGMQSVQGVPQPKKAGLFEHRPEMPEPETARPAPNVGGSINYFAAANRGALDDGAPAASGRPADNGASNSAAPPTQEVPQDNGQTQPNNANGITGRSGFLSQLKNFANQRLGSGNGLAGGSGMAGGMGQPFKPMEVNPNLVPGKPQSAKLLAMSGASRPSIGRTLGAGGGRQSSARNAMGQLYHADAQSRLAKNMSGEGSAYRADQAFSGAPSRGGSSIGGAGIGNGGAGVGSGSGEGGPIAPGSSSAPRAPSAGSGTDVTPWTSMVMMAMSLLMIASLILFIIGIINMIQRASMLGGFAGLELWKRMLYVMVLGMAATATMLGLVIATVYGQKTQGMILATGGAITTTMAALAMWGPHFKIPMQSWLAVLGGVVGIAASIGGMLFSNSASYNSSGRSGPSGNSPVQAAVRRMEGG